MKHTIAFAVAAALGLSPFAVGAAEVNIDAGPAQVHVDTNRDRLAQNYETRKVETNSRTANNESDRVTPKGLIRASELMDHAVFNNDGEQVGEVYDVVLDNQSGQIKYVAVSTGGFLGVGDALHAVPWKALKRETRDGERVCVLDVEKERLENAKGFDQENWPNMGDRNWQMTNDRQYQSKSSTETQKH